MSDEKVGLELDIKIQGAKSVAELKALIKDAKNEALRFGEGSAEFSKFTQIASQATNKLKELNKQVELMNPAAKAQAFRSLASTVIGGFSAMTGAAALFGAGNEDVNKVLLKVQSTTLILQGIQAVADASKQAGIVKNLILINLQNATESKSIIIRYAAAAAQAVLNAVMELNPIFIIVAAITAAIGAYELLIHIFDDTAKKQKEQNELIDSNIKLMEHAAEVSKTTADLKLQLATEEKKSLEEIHDLRLQNLKEEFSADKKIYFERAFQIQELKKQLKDASDKEKKDIQQKIDDYEAANKTIRDKHINDKIEEQIIDAKFDNDKKTRDKDATDKWKKDQADHKQWIKDHEIDYLPQQDPFEELSDSFGKASGKIKDENDKMNDHILAKMKEQVPLIQANIDTNVAQNKEGDDKIKKSHEDAISASIAGEESLASALQNLSDARTNRELAAAGSDEAKKEQIRKNAFERDKKLNEGQAIIHGLVAIEKTFATYGFTPFGIALAAAQVVETATTVAKIRSTTYQGGGTGGKITSAATSAGSGTPNIIEPERGTKLNADSSGGERRQPAQRVYVLERDITGTQAKIARVEELAQHG